jgi:hypothetical protein
MVHPHLLSAFTIVVLETRLASQSLTIQLNVIQHLEYLSRPVLTLIPRVAQVLFQLLAVQENTSARNLTQRQ